MAWFERPSAWARRLARSPSGQVTLFWLSFLDGLVLPVAVEAVIVPYMQVRRDILWRIPTIAVAGYVAAALVGYAIGAFFFDTLGVRIVAGLGLEESLARAQAAVAGRELVALLALAATPVPSLIVMIAAGALGWPLLLYVPAMAAARALRYFAAAVLVWWFGNRVTAWLARRYADPDLATSDRRPGQPDP